MQISAERKKLYQSSDPLETRVRTFEQYFQLESPMPEEIDRILGPYEGIHILDVGCGIGKSLLPFGPQFETVPHMIGLDSSKALLERAQQIQAERGLPRLHLVHATAERIPFPDESFDLVVARHMLYHVEDVALSVSEMERVLKSEGMLFATTNSAQSRPELNEIHARALKKFPHGKRIKRGSIRFSSENGEGILQHSFPKVRAIPWRGSYVFPDTQAPLAYYTSTPYFKQALDNPKELEQLKDSIQTMIQEVIDTKGTFTVSSWGAFFVAVKS